MKVYVLTHYEDSGEYVTVRDVYENRADADADVVVDRHTNRCCEVEEFLVLTERRVTCEADEPKPPKLYRNADGDLVPWTFLSAIERYVLSGEPLVGPVRR